MSSIITNLTGTILVNDDSIPSLNIASIPIAEQDLDSEAQLEEDFPLDAGYTPHAITWKPVADVKAKLFAAYSSTACNLTIEDNTGGPANHVFRVNFFLLFNDDTHLDIGDSGNQMARVADADCWTALVGDTQ